MWDNYSIALVDLILAQNYTIYTFNFMPKDFCAESFILFLNMFILTLTMQNFYDSYVDFMWVVNLLGVFLGGY